MDMANRSNYEKNRKILEDNIIRLMREKREVHNSYAKWKYRSVSGYAFSNCHDFKSRTSRIIHEKKGLKVV